MSATDDIAVEQASLGERVRGLLSNSWIALVPIGLVIIFTVLRPQFATPFNLMNMLVSASLLAIMAVGQTYIIITAGIDLSVGSVLVFASVAGVLVMRAMGGTEGGWGAAIAGCVVGIIAGLAWGLVNGLLIAKTRIPALIVTLGTLGMALGAAQLLANGVDIAAVPKEFSQTVGFGEVLGIPVLVIIALVVLALFYVNLSRTRFGRHTYAIGSNPEAARRAGIKVDRHLVTVYVIQGGLAGLAGVLGLARFSTTTLAGHNADNLAVISAVVLGGTSLFGGYGSLIGTAVAVLIPVVLQNGLIILGVQPFWQTILIGAILIIAVFIDQLKRSAFPGLSPLPHHDPPPGSPPPRRRRSTMKRSIAIAAASAAVLLGVAACSSPGTGGGESTGDAGGSDEQITIAYSSPNTGNNYHISFQCGVVKAAEEAGVALDITGANSFSASVQIPIINAIAATAPDALITAPTDTTALIGPLSQVKAAGTQIIIYDTGLDDDTIAAATVTADNEGGGVLAAQELVKLMGENGKVLLIDIAAGVASTNARAAGVISELSKYPGITILDTQYDGADPTKDADIVNATLAAHPDLTAIVPVYNQAATGAVTALKANGKLADIPVITFDADPGIVQAVRDGDIAVVVNQTPFEQARIAVDDAIKAVKGEPIAETLVRTPMPVLTKANIDDPAMQAEFYVDKLCTV